MIAFLQKNITSVKYWFIIINILFMIIAIRAVVNYQNILSSIDTIQNDIIEKENHTNYINNFITPYLESDYAPYFIAHENNQIFAGETIIKITEIESGAIQNTAESWWIINPIKINKPKSSPVQARQRYLQNLTKDIVWRR